MRTVSPNHVTPATIPGPESEYSSFIRSAKLTDVVQFIDREVGKGRAPRGEVRQVRDADSVPVRIHEPLSGVPFLLPGKRLGIGWGTLGDPISAFEGFYLEDKRGLTRVRGPGDLVGQVRINTADNALRYVRLFTSPATVKTFGLPVWLEVVPASEVDTDFVYGRTSRLYVAGYVADLRRLANMKDHVREYAVVSDREWRSFGLGLPSVTKIGAVFTVTRGLVRITEESPWGTGIVQQVAETVSSDGRISRRVLSKRKVPGLLVCLLPEE